MMKWLKELGESRKLLGELSEGNQEIAANMRQLSEQIGELSESFRMMRKENDSLFQDGSSTLRIIQNFKFALNQRFFCVKS